MAVENEYPKAMYHASEPPKVVVDADAEASLGPEWHANPNEVHNQPEPAKAVEVEEPAEAPTKRGPGRPKTTDDK